MDIQTGVDIGVKAFVGIWSVVALAGFLRGIIKYIKLKPRIRFTHEGEEEII